MPLASCIRIWYNKIWQATMHPHLFCLQSANAPKEICIRDANSPREIFIRDAAGVKKMAVSPRYNTVQVYFMP